MNAWPEGNRPCRRCPPADAKGNRPALEYIQVSIARDIIKERRALGLSQSQLAELAGLRQETLSRLESGKHSPTVRTVEKIDRALKRYAKSKAKRPAALNHTPNPHATRHGG